MCNFGAESHLAAGVMSVFNYQLADITQEITSTFVQLSRKTHEDSDYCHECCHTLML